MLFNRLWGAAFVLSMILAGCGTAAVSTPTDVPSPTASPTARPTASPTDTAAPSPTPTARLTPSPTSPPPTATETPMPTAAPTVFGVIRSRQRVNVRRGPGVEFATFESLAPGAGVQVVGQNEAETWYSVKLASGDEGWVSADLLFMEDAPTVSPTAALAETAAPSAAIDDASPTAADAPPLFDAPIVDLNVVYLTATALVSDAAPTEDGADTDGAAISDEVIEAPTRAANARRSGVDVFAFCNDSSHGVAPPTNLRAGSSIEIFWAWYATDDAYLRQHIANASHELRVNGLRIANVDQFRMPARTQGRNRVLYWYVPFGPLEAGDYSITYRVTWRHAISDGYDSFGPGTATEFEEESCDFVAR